jgi:hypothetical protein
MPFCAPLRAAELSSEQLLNHAPICLFDFVSGARRWNTERAVHAKQITYYIRQFAYDLVRSLELNGANVFEKLRIS